MGGNKKILQHLVKSITECDDETAFTAVKRVMEEGIEPIKAIEHGIAVGLKKIGDDYERGEVFLPELIMAANIAQKALRALLEHLPKGSEYRGHGRVVIGTVEGDIHDIGKNMVVAMLRANGFDVVDLGVDVSAKKFVDSVKELKPNILGMSALLTTTMLKQEEVIETLKRESIRSDVRVIIGGVPVTEEWVEKINADGLGKDAIDAVQKIKKFVEK